MAAAISIARLPTFARAKLLLYRAVALARLLYGSDVAAFNKIQIDRIRAQALDTLRPNLDCKQRHRDLALALLYYDAPVDIACMWLIHCIKAMWTHMDRYPEAIHVIQKVWEQYTLYPWRTFGPVNSMIKAARPIGVTPETNMELKSFEGFTFNPITADIQKILLFVKG